MKCKLITPTRERQTPHFKKIYRKAVAHSRGIEVLESRIAPATFFVSNANDSGTGSLRQAILDANSTQNSGGEDLISFANIPTGTFVIQPTTELPAITESVIIDGYTAPGTSQNTTSIGTNATLRVVLSGSLLNSGSGLILGDAFGDPYATGGSTVRGLVINDFHPGINDSGNGILIQSSGNKVEGNFLGTTTGGDAGLGNSSSGVSVGGIFNTNTLVGNTIGGPALADRNVISGNTLGINVGLEALDTHIFGNLIGTDKNGEVAIPNTHTGIRVGGNNTQIGGAGVGEGNVVSGNTVRGISIGTGSNATVLGNIIGLNAAGNAVLPNGRGILLDNGATNITIGGSSTGAGNLISGNIEAGIEIGSSVGDGSANNVTVRGNKIGTDVSGTLKLGNQNGGIKVFGSTGTTIGGTSPLDGNVIAFNTNAAGILVREDAGPSSVTILGNSIFGNSRLGIDLGGGKENFFGVTENDGFDADQGPNGLTNWPTLTNFNNTGTDVMLDFSISAQPGTNYRIEFFALAPGQVDVSGSGQGAVFLGSQDVNTNAAGQYFGNFAQPIGLPANSYFTATITDTSAGQTSEFSPALGLPGGTYTWNGAQSSDWFDALNWTPNAVPGPFDTAIYNGGTNPIQLDGDAGVLHFQHSAGAMTGFGGLFVRDTFTWTGGSQDGANLFLVGTTATINGGGQPLVWNADSSFVINDGTLTIGGAGLAFNIGQFGINPNGKLTLNAGIFDQDGVSSVSTIYNAGKIEKFGTGAFGLETTTVQNSGSIESRAGSLTLNGYTGLGGSKLGLTGGNIQTSGTLTLDTDGELFGTGTINGNLSNNGGYVYVGIGEVTGILNLTGAYTQSASGTLVVDLRGTTAGTNYDQFAVGGTASIDGVLNVTILPGYTPALGHTLNVLTSFGLTGTFSAVVGEGAFSTNYTSTNAQLVRNGLTYTWDAGGSTDTSWFNPLNWAPDGLPGTSDVAVLNTNATITLDTTDATVGDFIQSNGTLTGSKTLNIIGSFSWNGGTQTGTGSTHSGAESSTVLGGSAKTLDTRTLFVQGSGSSNNGSALTLNNGAKLQAGGIYEVLLATPFQSGGNGGEIEVRPEGTLRKSGATATTIPVGLTFTENGLLEVLGGTFSVLSGGSATDAIFRVTPGNTLNFNSTAGFSLFNNVSFEGGGTVALIGGSLSNGSTTVLNAAANTTFAISGGTFVANTTTIVSNGPLHWSGGSLTGFGTWGINGPLDISGSAVKTLSQLFLNIAPTSAASWSGTGNLSLLQSAQINVGGAVNVISDLDVLDGDSSGNSLSIFATGSFLKNSSGTTDIQIPVTSDGFVTSNSGTLQFSSTFTQNSGLLSVGSGSFIAASNPLQINDGTVAGTGTITGSLINSGGIVSPGNGPNNAGILTITGDYSQGNDGELFIEAQGTTPGSGYDQLQVGGTTSLFRKLSFVTFNGYSAVAPANFDVITSTGAISGNFTVENLPPNGSVTYATNSVNVAFAPGDLVVDGTTGDDTIVLSVQSTVAGYTLNGGAFTPLGTVSGFVFNGGDGNDILIIDFANGNPIPTTNGVNYDGQGESGGFDDKLMITGGSQGTVDYNLDNATSGSVVMSNFGTVNFTSLTPISNSGSATDVNFNLPDSTNILTLGDDGTAGNTLSRLSAATLPQLDFANPSGSLTFNSSSGDDRLTLNALPDFNAALNVGSTLSPFVSLSLAGAVTLAAGKSVNVASTSVSTTTSGALTVSSIGFINIIANDVSLATGSTLSATGTVSFTPLTTGRSVDLGTETNGQLSLTDTELDTITAGTLQIGNANSGAITVSAAITHANNLSLTTGAGVSGSGALTLAAGKNLGVTASGVIDLSGAITVPGTMTLAAGAAHDITLTNASNAFATVSITSGATVSLLDDGGFDLGAMNISTLLSLQSAGGITQSGVLSGTGALTKLGTGTLSLSSTNTYTGVTNVNAGTLIVLGSLADGSAAVDVVIASGAILTGTGTIDGSVSSSGRVEPGGSGAVGTLTISGNFTQDTGGTLAMDIGGVSAAQYDGLDVGGTAALAGILSVTNIQSFTPTGGSFFTLVTASSVTGVFNTFNALGYSIPDQSSTALTIIASDSTVVVPKDPFTFLDQNGDTVKVSLTGKGSLNVLLVGGALDNADIASIELIGTDLTSKLSVVITSKPRFDQSFGTDIGRIFTSGPLQHVGSITLGSNVNLGDGVADAQPDLRVTGKMNALILDDLAPNAFIKLGEGLPYNVPNESKTPDTYNNRPSLTVGRVLGAGVNIEVLGDGTPEGVGGGGFSKVVFNSWAFNGFLRTTQGIGSFLVKTGDFYGILEVDKFSNGEQTTASVGSMSIAQGAWGSSGSEIEGNVGSFDAAAFLAGATITAGSIGSVKTTGALAGTFILTDPDAAAVPTFTVNSDFTGRVVSATSIKKLKIKGDFTGSLEAPSIGSITAFAFLGTAGVTDITTTAGKLGLLTSTAGIIRDYTIVSDAAFSGFKVKLGKLGTSTVGIDNVHVTATSIGAINVDLSSAKGSTGVDLTGIRNSSFATTATGIVKGTTGSIGKVTVKLKGGTDGDGTGIINTTFDARVLAGEFGMGLLASTVNSLGNVSVNLSGFGGSSIGLDDAAFEGDVLGTTNVAVTRGKGASTARGVDGTTFTATGAIGALSFSGDVTANMVTDTEVLAGGKIAGLKVAAKTSAFGSLVDSAIAAGQSLVVAGTDKQQKAALSAASLGVVSISGSLTSSKIVAGANIGAVTVGASATDSLILAGAKLGGDFTIGDGNESYQRAAAITSVTVGGAFTRSSIIAGIVSTNATFGDADDEIAAVAGTLVQSSSIGALKFGAGSGTNAAAPAIPHSFAIQAAAIKSLANATSAAVKDFATALYLDAGTAGEDATDVLVRLRA